MLRSAMKCSITLLLLLLVVSGIARAQSMPLPMQSSIASGYVGSYTGFQGLQVATLSITWHTQAARWLMVFDQSTVPSNGAVTPYWCSPVQGAGGQTDGQQAYDFTFHPMQLRNQVTVVASTNTSGCTTLTADSTNDVFQAQIR